MINRNKGRVLEFFFILLELEVKVSTCTCCTMQVADVNKIHEFFYIKNGFLIVSSWPLRCVFSEKWFYYLCIILFPEKDSSHQRIGKNCMESAQEMKSTTSNWGKASSSRNTKAKVLHLHRSMLTGGNINAPLHVRAWFIIQRVIWIFVKCLSANQNQIFDMKVYITILMHWKLPYMYIN